MTGYFFISDLTDARIEILLEFGYFYLDVIRQKRLTESELLVSEKQFMKILFCDT